MQINFLFSSSHPLAWKTISMQVKKSYSNICFRVAYSKNKIQKWYLCSETNPELDLKNIIVKSLWIALQIDFWIQINFLFSSLHPLAWKTIFRCKLRNHIQIFVLELHIPRTKYRNDICVQKPIQSAILKNNC